MNSNKVPTNVATIDPAQPTLLDKLNIKTFAACKCPARSAEVPFGLPSQRSTNRSGPAYAA